MKLIIKNKLYGLKNYFNHFVNLYNSNKLPNVIMLTGKKGVGKFTLVNHFLYFIFNKENYNTKDFIIEDENLFYNKYKNNLFSNIIYISGSNFKNVKIEDIRALKSQLLKSTISNKDRFIVFDDVELFNKNSLNALLKIIEEPSKKNFFILVNNGIKPMLETITSRSLEFKIMISNHKRIEIIDNLINEGNLKIFIDYKSMILTPGNFILFNKICEEQDINIEDNLSKNIEKLINLYKKNKDIDYINLLLLIIDFYFSNLIKSNKISLDKILTNKNFILKNINNFVNFNINPNSLINSINNHL